jgi:hypothetical protein
MSLLIGTTAGAYELDNPEPLIDGTRINHMARHKDSWWVIDGKGRVLRDGQVVASADDGVALNCLQPAPESVWVGATEARLYRVEDGRLALDEFFADAPGRDTWFTPWGGAPDVRSMSMDTDGALFINVHVGGILRYDNTGIAATVDIDADIHQVAAHPDRLGDVVAAGAYGVGYSHNGHDFDFRDEGLHAAYCRAVAILGNSLFVSASTGPSTTNGRLYRGALDEGALTQCNNGLPEQFGENLNTHCLAVIDESVYAGVGNTVWRSDDLGDSWTAVAESLPKITCLV